MGFKEDGVKSSRSASEIRKLLEDNSSFWSQQLRAHPGDIEWLLNGSPLNQQRSVHRLESEWRRLKWSSLGFHDTFPALRRVKRLEMLRITVRDLSNCTTLDETVAELSALADFCLQRALDCVLKDMITRHAAPQAQFAIFGMGKLGGQELNYSSDIDLIVVYSEEGAVGRLSHHAFFSRATETIVKEFHLKEKEGSLFRVDLRLRPEGNSGPITRSLESYENYYAAFGEVWERMALQKARLVAGDEELGYEFIQHLQPFCFPKHLPSSALDEIFQIKTRIEDEILKEGGLERHVKLGRGGIREIEFAVQALQLLHGARHVFSQERGTLKSLQALQRMDLLSAKDAAALTRAYVFLRRLEHRLQMREDRQTHLVPEDRATQTALARGLGFKNHADFDVEWKSHMDFVRVFFHGIVRPHGAEQPAAPALDWAVLSPEHNQLLKKSGFSDPEKVAAILQTLAHGPEYAHVSQRTRGLFNQLCPHVLEIAGKLARPDSALQQFERFIEAYGSRGELYDLLTSKPKILELLLKLFDHSRFLTDIIVRQPALLEAIAYEGLLVGGRTRSDMEAALARETVDTLEGRLRLFKRAELLRIELRDILGLASSLEETCSEISQLADVCLAAAVHFVDASFRKSPSVKKGSRNSASRRADKLCIIALGKYGGRELSYGSDLDVIFVGGSSEEAARVIAMMSQEQSEGIVFKMDMRLRPDGEDGPLTLPLEGYQEYYSKRAQFWEKQALTRARVAAGDPKHGQSFIKMVDKIIYSHSMSATEAREVSVMRMRIEKERGDPDDPARDFKTGAGGLVDIEFLAQARQLRYGYKHAGLRRASTLDVLRAMPRIGEWKPEDAAGLEEEYIWLRKLESSLRRFHNAPISQLPSSREEWTVVAKHLGLKDTPALERELEDRRKRVRKMARRLTDDS